MAPAGHTYRAWVVVAGASEPLVFPRSAGKLDQTFAVLSAQNADLGVVRHYSAVPEGGFLVNDELNESTCEENDDEVNEPDGDNNNEGVNEPDGDNNDGDFDDDDNADVGSAFAVPENNLPNTLGCNDHDDEDEDEDEEEEEEDDD